jgi:hypothetical protein
MALTPNKWAKRYIVVNGRPREQTMAVVEDLAIFYPKFTRFGKRKTLDYIKADSTYASRKEALEAMAGERGFSVRGRGIFPGVRRTDASGARCTYDLKGNTVWGEFFATRKEAATSILAEVSTELAEAKEREAELKRQIRAVRK